MARTKKVPFGDLMMGDAFRIGRRRAIYIKDEEEYAVLVVPKTKFDLRGSLEYMYLDDLVTPVDLYYF